MMPIITRTTVMPQPGWTPIKARTPHLLAGFLAARLGASGDPVKEIASPAAPSGEYPILRPLLLLQAVVLRQPGSGRARARATPAGPPAPSWPGCSGRRPRPRVRRAGRPPQG